MSIRPHGLIALIAFAAAGATMESTPALADIYKWVDEKGVVNYGESPPAGRAARILTRDDGKVSVVPVDPGLTERARDGEQAALQRRVEQLEQELARQRDAQVEADQSQAERLARSREECRVQREVDCDDDMLRLRYGTLFYPPVVVVRPHPPHGWRKPWPRPVPHTQGTVAPKRGHDPKSARFGSIGPMERR